MSPSIAEMRAAANPAPPAPEMTQIAQASAQVTNIPVAYTAMALLDSQCDGANSHDDIGFAGQHASKGKWIASLLRDGKDLSPANVAWMYDALDLYKNTQLKGLNLELMAEERPALEAAANASLARFTERKEVTTPRAEEVIGEDYRKAKMYLTRIKHDNVEARDLEFFSRLREWSGEHTDKQKPHVIRLAKKYFSEDLVVLSPKEEPVSEPESTLAKEGVPPATAPPTPLPLAPAPRRTLQELIAAQKQEAATPQELVEEIAKTTPALVEPEDVPVLQMPPDLPPTPQEVDAFTVTEAMLDPSQRAALGGLMQHFYACMTGAAGTGKSAITRLLLDRLQSLAAGKMLEDGIAINGAVVAYTGKAVQQQKKNLPGKFHGLCDTIHGLLEFAPEFYEVWDPSIKGKQPFDAANRTTMRFVPGRNRLNPLDLDFIIIDEAGMLGLPLAKQLFDALKPRTRVYFIGDINQLPPVQGRSIFGFALNKYPSFELTKIHRQKGETNPIVENAWRILNGQMPVQTPGKFDMLDIGGAINDYMDNGKRIMGAVTRIKAVAVKLSREGAFNPDTDAVIVPTNGDNAESKSYNMGQLPLNAFYVGQFNPSPKEHSGEIKGVRTVIDAGFEQKHFAVGDKVMVLKNDRANNLTNGMVGIVVDIKRNGNATFETAERIKAVKDSIAGTSVEVQGIAVANRNTGNRRKQDEEGSEEFTSRAATHIVTVNFGLNLEGEEIVRPFDTVGGIQGLTLAYAMTCHKLQGSECKTVIVVVHSAVARMCYREWLYTAVTRGAERVVLLYNGRGLSSALRNQMIKGNTMEEKTQKFLEWSGESLPKDDPAYATGSGPAHFLPHPKELRVQQTLETQDVSN